MNEDDTGQGSDQGLYKSLSQSNIDNFSENITKFDRKTVKKNQSVDQKLLSKSLGKMDYEGMMLSDDEESTENIMDEKRCKVEDNIDGGSIDAKFQDTVEKRRERNRLLARKTRQRKKVFYEALQRQVAQLVKENEILRGIVQTKKIIDRKHTLPTALTDTSSITSVNSETVTSSVPGVTLEKADSRLVSVIQASQRAFVITNPGLPDNPIIFASKGFLDLTLYRLDEVLGKNCRFLQGPGTDRRQVESLRKGIFCGVDTTVVLLNYRADGTSFYNQVFVAPLRDKNRKIANYVGVLLEVEVQELAPSKQVIAPVKEEKKEAKDEEVDDPSTTDSVALEAAKAPMKPSSNKRALEDVQFDFDDFI